MWPEGDSRAFCTFNLPDDDSSKRAPSASRASERHPGNPVPECALLTVGPKMGDWTSTSPEPLACLVPRCTPESSEQPIMCAGMQLNHESESERGGRTAFSGRAKTNPS